MSTARSGRTRHARHTRTTARGERTIRRPTTLVATLAVLVALAAPAWAGSSFTQGAEAQAGAENHGLVLTITEPEDEAYGDTSSVTVQAATGFTVVGCQSEPATWTCTFDAGSVTFTRTVLGSLVDTTLGFSVAVPGTNGTYGFPVAQSDGTSTVGSRPAVTVVGGSDPAPPEEEAEEEPPPSEQESTQDPSTSDEESTGDGGTAPAGGTSTDDSSGDSSTSSGTTSTSSDNDTSSSGSTSPRRTQGRSSGTTLEVTPGEPVDGDDPAIAQPDVADDPAVAPPADAEPGDDGDTGTATMTAIRGEASDPAEEGGLPWQQLLGGTLLLAGGAAVAIRRWDLLQRIPAPSEIAGRLPRPSDLLDRFRSGGS